MLPPVLVIVAWARAFLAGMDGGLGDGSQGLAKETKRMIKGLIGGDQPRQEWPDNRIACKDGGSGWAFVSQDSPGQSGSLKVGNNAAGRRRSGQNARAPGREYVSSLGSYLLSLAV